jgi:hypothetical protein
MLNLSISKNLFYLIDSAKSEDDDEEEDDEEDEHSNKENISNFSVPLSNGEPITVRIFHYFDNILLYFIQRDAIDLSTTYERFFDEMFDSVQIVCR